MPAAHGVSPLAGCGSTGAAAPPITSTERRECRVSLTQREFLFLDDLLHQEELEVKCCLDFAQRAQDPQIKQTFLSLAQQHQQHFDRLLNFLGQYQPTGFQDVSQSAGIQYSQYGQPAVTTPGTAFYSSTGTSGSATSQLK